MARQFNYNSLYGEFFYNPSGGETGDITGNRVFVDGEGPLTRFRVEIDDFGSVIGALNRLIKRINPHFIFPQKNTLSLTKEEKQAYVNSGGTYCPYCNSKSVDYGTDNEVTCFVCKRYWKDVYVLSDIAEM